MIKLTTDLRSISITHRDSEPASYVYACYERDIPFSTWTRGKPYDLACYSSPFSTYVDNSRVIKLERDAFYRLPEAACRALGVDEDICLVPLYVEMCHVPYVDFIEDSHGRAYAPELATDAACEQAHSTRLRYGSWTVCGLLRSEQAKEWVRFNEDEWRVFQSIGYACRGRDTSWLPLQEWGVTHFSFKGPLLPRPVEVSRETV